MVDALVDIAEKHGASAAQVALAWLLGRPGVSSLVIGARTEDQLIGNLAAANLQLGADERDLLDDLTAPALIYPYWHQAKIAADRLSAADLSLLERHLPRHRGSQ
jgi:diketogulonate reductase-like aldo/keto reductase